MGAKSKINSLKKSRIPSKIICFYIVFILLISIFPFAGLSEPPEINSTPGGGYVTSDNYVNISVNITSSENVSSLIDFNRSLVGYWNFEHISGAYIVDNSTHANNATMIGRTFNNKTKGVYGDGFYFNGSSGGQLNISHADEFNLTSELTLELWFKEFETSFNETYVDNGYCLSIDKTSDGGYIATGYINESGKSIGDIFLLKINSNGQEEWSKTFGDAGKDERGYSVKQTSDGGYVIAGYKNNGTDDDGWVIKTDGNGTLLWNRTYGETGEDNNDRLHSIIENNSGNYVVAGYTNSYSLCNNLWVFEINYDNGNMTNETNKNLTLGKSGWPDEGFCIQQTADDGYIIAGRTKSYGSGDLDVWLVKINSNYNELWNRTFGSNEHDGGYCVAQTTDSGYILTGVTRSYNTSGESDIWVIKTDDYGNETIWTGNKTFGGDGADYGLTVVETMDGGYVIFGTVETYDGSDSWEYILIKLNSDGNESWNRTFKTNSKRGDFGHLQETYDGGFIFGGIFNISGVHKFWIAKTDSNGNITTSNNNQSVNKTLIGKGRDSYQLELFNGTITCYLNGSPVVSNKSSLYNLSQKWNHLVLTYDKNAEKTKLFLNTDLIASNSLFSGNITETMNNLTIGKNFSGIIDEVRVWNRVLTHDEINASYDTKTNYSRNFTGLSEGTYNYRIYAISLSGYENQSNFTITIINPPINFTATTINRTQINLTWTTGLYASTTYIEWNTTSNWQRGQGQEIYNGTGTTYQHTGLTPDTTYYYQAWSYNETENAWSPAYITANNTTIANQAPIFDQISPANNSITQELSFTWQIKIQDPEGDTFNWTIQCNNGQNNSQNDATNGSKNLNLSGLAYSTKYTIWVNATDGYDWKNITYYFTTKSKPSGGGTTAPPPSQPDETGEQNETVTDTTGPIITIISPKDGETVYDKTSEIKARYSDESGIDISSIVFRLNGEEKTASISSSSLVYKPSSALSIGTHNVYLKVSDILGNSNIKTWSFKIGQSIHHETQNITNITKDNTTIIDPTNKTVINSIEIRPNKNYTNLRIEITDLGEEISEDIEKPDPHKIEQIVEDINMTYILYRYLNFAVISNYTYIEDIGDIKINFTVSLSWLKNNDMNISNVSMIRYYNNSWVKLNTSFIKETEDDKLLFQSKTLGFSTFAVVGSKVVKKDEPLRPPDEPGIPWIVIIGLIISAIVIFIIVLFKAGYIYIERE